MLPLPRWLYRVRLQALLRSCLKPRRMQPPARMHPAPSRCRRLLPAATPLSTRTSIIYAFCCFLLSPCLFLESVRAGLAGANANDLFNRGDEYLAVADLARAGRTLNRFYGLVDQIVGDRRFDLHFWQEIDHVLGAAIQLRVALLAAEAFTSVTVMPETPIADNASRASSSLNGLMIAVMSFMYPSLCVEQGWRFSALIWSHA